MLKHLLTITLIFVFCTAQAAGTALRFGIASTPSSGDALETVYKDLNDYLAEKLGRDVTPVTEQDFTSMNTLLRKGQVDFAATGSTALTPRDRNTLRIIAIPVIHGKMSFRSYIITNKRYKITSVKELKGHTFAFTDRMTGSGALYPIYLIIKTFNNSPEHILKKIYYTRSNERSIYLLNRGVIEAAAVDSVVFDKIHKHTPKATENITVIHKSPEMIAPPFVASARLDSVTLRRLKNILLNMHNDPEGRVVLREMNIDRYAPAGRKAYQSFMDIRKSVDSFGHTIIKQ